MGDKLEDLMKDSPSSDNEEDTINITQEDIDEINGDIVDNPPTKEDVVEQSSVDQLKTLMDLMQGMDESQRNKILSTLAQKNNLNLENNDYDERSKKNYLKMKIRQKLRDKANTRMNKGARLKYAQKMQDKLDNASDKDKVPEEEIEVSKKTLRNRRRRQKKKAKKTASKSAGMSSDDNTEATDVTEDVDEDDSNSNAGDQVKPVPVE